MRDFRKVRRAVCAIICIMAAAMLAIGCATQESAIKAEIQTQQFARARNDAQKAYQDAKSTMPGGVMGDIFVCPLTIIGLPACPFLLADDLSGGPERRKTAYSNLYQQSTVAELDRADQLSKAGNFTTAQTLYQEVANIPRTFSDLTVPGDLSVRAEDGLCSTSFELGDRDNPSESTMEICKRASQHGGTASSQIVRRIEQAKEKRAAEAAAAQAKIEAAEEQHQNQRAAQAIARISERYPEVHGLTQDQFTNFIVRAYTNGLGAPFFSDARITGNSMTVTVPNPDVQALLNSQAALDQVNDYFVAWCGCSGTTRIVGDYYGREFTMPFNVTLDPEDGHSRLMRE